jgi:hypothetical protein
MLDLTNETQEVQPFNQEAFDKASEEPNTDEIKGTGQTIHWRNCDRAFQRKFKGGVWLGMPKEGGSVKVSSGYSVYFIRGANGEVKVGLDVASIDSDS